MPLGRVWRKVTPPALAPVLNRATALALGGMVALLPRAVVMAEALAAAMILASKPALSVMVPSVAVPMLRVLKSATAGTAGKS